ncbi:minor tail protein [Klebsiella phage vB_KleS-HSE3]|nr:minor tail protein [Klebsiella phage vB_KleS-HSE3]
MSNIIFDEATKLDPSGKITLVEIDGSEFGAGIIRCHYCQLPHTSREILDAANSTLNRDQLFNCKSANTRGTVTKNEDRNTINFKSLGVDANLLLPAFSGGLTGGKYQVIEVVGRWVTPPPSTDILYQIYYKTAAHDFSPGYLKSGTLASVTEDLGDGWLKFSFDMSKLSAGGADWVNSQIIGVRLDLWQQAVGEMEIKRISILNNDPGDIDGSKLTPKSIWFDNVEYGYWAFMTEGIEFSSEQQGTPTLSIGNQSGVISAYLRAYQQMVGAKVKIIQTYAKFLDPRNFEDGNEFADSMQQWTQLYYIDRPDYEGDEYVRFALSSPLDLQNFQVPTRQITTFCQWQARGLYGKGLDAGEENGCSWNRGTAKKWYDKKGNEVDDITKDECGGCIQDCRLRFGQLVSDPKAAVLDYGGFISVRLID